MKKLIAFVICLSCFTANAVAATSLVWQTSKADAISVAEKEGKKILMLAGRETCPVCKSMKNTVFESASPPIKSMIQRNFVPWFCDVNSSTEYQTYESGLGTYDLPLICGIDPDNIEKYLDRSAGKQEPEEFYSRLEGLMSETDEPGKVLYNYYNKSDHEMSSDHDWEYDVYPEAPISYEEGVCYYQNRITAAPASFDFGEVRTGTFSAPGNLTISNTGDAEIETGTLSVTGQDALEFMVQNDTCSDRTIGSSETCSLDVIFLPGSDGAKTADIILPDSANFPALNISLDGTGTETEPGWVKINGTVSGENGIPLCTMVLANGQYVFTCGENDGIYEMDVPLNENGIVSLFCFADGFAPFKQDLTPEQAKGLTVDMTPASPDQPRMVLNTQAEPIVGSGWFKISGTVATEDGTLLCAMVLANGQHRFSCTQAGEYEMEVPLNENGEIALLSFADGFQPFSYTFKP
ncbi:MAG: choice-of-anchor D domain-containing protein [Desulfobacterales bacterium]|nr:choice-of-anchor D domain-containing protein [Desulfobacterales bacterium]